MIIVRAQSKNIQLIAKFTSTNHHYFVNILLIKVNNDYCLQKTPGERCFMILHILFYSLSVVFNLTYFRHVCIARTAGIKDKFYCLKN